MSKNRFANPPECTALYDMGRAIFGVPLQVGSLAAFLSEAQPVAGLTVPAGKRPTLQLVTDSK